MQPDLNDNYIRAITFMAVKRLGLKFDSFLNTPGDILSVAWFGIARARDHYNPDRGCSFTTYSVFCAMRAIKAHLYSRHDIAYGPRKHRTFTKSPLENSPLAKGDTGGCVEIDIESIDADLFLDTLSEDERAAVRSWMEGHTWEELQTQRAGKASAKAAAQYALHKLRSRVSSPLEKGDSPAPAGQGVVE